MSVLQSCSHMGDAVVGAFGSLAECAGCLHFGMWQLAVGHRHRRALTGSTCSVHALRQLQIASCAVCFGLSR